MNPPLLPRPMTMRAALLALLVLGLATAGTAAAAPLPPLPDLPALPAPPNLTAGCVGFVVIAGSGGVTIDLPACHVSDVAAPDPDAVSVPLPPLPAVPALPVPV